MIPLLAAFLSLYTYVDIEAVRADGDPASFLRQVRTPDIIGEIQCEILIAGAGMGGMAAALRADAMGRQVCLVEESSWVGGQMTAAGVSALDENKFIELTGGPRAYSEMRRRIRAHYQPLKRLDNFNPGNCYVSSLCFEPRVGVQVLETMLKAHPRVTVLKRTRVLDLERVGGRITAALLYQMDARRSMLTKPKYVLDATEMGDLLPLAKTPYAVGAEAQSVTQEPDAPAQANPACVQSFTYTFIVENKPGAQQPIPKPADYEKIRDHQPFSLKMNYPTEFGWRGAFEYTLFGEAPPIPNNMSPGPLVPWRRVLDGRQFAGRPNDLALMNWPRQDYHDESVLDRSPLDTARILQAAKRLSFAFLHWLQADLKAPSLQMRTDQMDSPDGLSKVPYIRESRRLQALGSVREQDIVFEGDLRRARAAHFADSIGTGFYMVDIHPCGANEKGRMRMPKPFQIPLAAMLPRDLENFLPAGKNLGVTHLTNGAYRLHPIEWNIGEAAGVVAALHVRSGSRPSFPQVQAELTNAGVQIFWFDDLPESHPAFAAIQMAAQRGQYPVRADDLHAVPDAPITRKETAHALARHFEVEGDGETVALQKGWMAVDHRNWFHGDLPLYWTDIRLPNFQPANAKRSGPVTRAEFFLRLRELK